jgi:hypothetical protein
VSSNEILRGAEELGYQDIRKSDCGDQELSKAGIRLLGYQEMGIEIQVIREIVTIGLYHLISCFPETYILIP